MQQSTHLLATKLFPPPSQPGLVARRRLTERLEGLSGARLILISAPAGFGKTTLVASWAEEHQHPTAWVSLDKGDNDPHRFLAYLIAAIQGLFPEVGAEAATSLALAPPPPIPSILTSLVNDIAGVEGRFLVVLDDFHEIEHPAVHQIILFLLDHAPPQLRIGITSRVDPDLPLARYRVSGDLLELRAADLRFTRDEAAAFFADRMGLHLSAEQLAMLEGRTEGWIAGLQMAGLALQGRDGEETEGFIEAFSGTHRFVLEYLLEEVMSRLQKELERALLELSILDRFTSSLCEVVTGVASGAELLRTLERGNLFLVPLDSRREWYRYHHLFADLLQHRLRKLWPERLAPLHHRASAWFESRGMILEAGSHLHRAGDADAILAFVDTWWRAIFENQDGHVSYDWLGIVPREKVLRHSRAAMVMAWGTTGPTRNDELREMLLEIEPHIGMVEEEIDRREITGQIALLRAIVAYRDGEYQDTIAYGEEALRHFPDTGTAEKPTQWNVSSAMVYTYLGRAYRNIGDNANAERIFEQALIRRRAERDTATIGSALMMLARHRLMLGKLRVAEEESIACIELLRSTGDEDSVYFANHPTAISTLAEIHYERNELARAREEAMMAMELFDHSSLSDTGKLLVFYIAYEEIALALDDESLIATALDRIRDLQGRNAPNPMLYVETIRAERRLLCQLALKEGRMDAVADWLRYHREEEKGEWQYYTRMLDELLSCRVRLAIESGVRSRESGVGREWREDDPTVGLEELSAELEGLSAELHERGVMRLAIEARLLLARAMERAGNLERAFDELEAALSEAAPEGMLRVFLNEGSEGKRLLDAFIKRRGMRATLPSAFVGNLLAAFGGEREELPAPRPEGAGRAVAELMLTERELDMLRLIALGLTNGAIASKLYISLNTVKTHIYNLFMKLEVKSRVEAIARGREMGMLE